MALFVVGWFLLICFLLLLLTFIMLPLMLSRQIIPRILLGCPRYRHLHGEFGIRGDLSLFRSAVIAPTRKFDDKSVFIVRIGVIKPRFDSLLSDFRRADCSRLDCRARARRACQTRLRRDSWRGAFQRVRGGVVVTLAFSVVTFAFSLVDATADNADTCSFASELATRVFGLLQLLLWREWLRHKTLLRGSLSQVQIELMDEALHPIPLLHCLITVARALFPL